MEVRRRPAASLPGWAAAAAAGASIALAGLPSSLPPPLDWPFSPTWLIAVGLVLGLLLIRRRRVEPVLVLAVMAIVGWVLVDLTFLEGRLLRDLDLYAKSGLHFRLHQPVYLDHLVSVRPPDPTDYPFVYPPPSLPIAAAISILPADALRIAWLVGSTGAALLGLHRIGLRGWWLIAFLAWPPVAEGIYVGNVAIVLFLLFALAPWSGVGLVVGPLLKPASAVLGLWLVVERRWREIGLGLLIVIGLVLASLAVTGIDPWSAWLAGLSWYARSQPEVPATFYGIALERYLPALVVGLAGIGLLGLALLVRGRALLARLGVVSVLISPSLYAHGFIVALPALLELRATVVWAALAFMAAPLGPTWLIAPAIVLASWGLPGLRRGLGTTEVRPGDDWLQPLRPAPRPWPGAPDSRR
ncbi:MAG TPA: glycosyltransferase family 87 protein [Candidatus Limnocylindrales bacterium]